MAVSAVSDLYGLVEEVAKELYVMSQKDIPPDVREAIQRGNQVHILNQSTNETYIADHGMTERQVQILLAGSLINLLRARRVGHGA